MDLFYLSNFCFIGGILSGISDLAMTGKYAKNTRIDNPDVKQIETKQSESVQSASEQEEKSKEKQSERAENVEEETGDDTPNLSLGRN